MPSSTATFSFSLPWTVREHGSTVLVCCWGARLSGELPFSSPLPGLHDGSFSTRCTRSSTLYVPCACSLASRWGTGLVPCTTEDYLGSCSYKPFFTKDVLVRHGPAGLRSLCGPIDLSWPVRRPWSLSLSLSLEPSCHDQGRWFSSFSAPPHHLPAFSNLLLLDSLVMSGQVVGRALVATEGFSAPEAQRPSMLCMCICDVYPRQERHTISTSWRHLAVTVCMPAFEQPAASSQSQSSSAGRQGRQAGR